VLLVLCVLPLVLLPCAIWPQEEEDEEEEEEEEEKEEEERQLQVHYLLSHHEEEEEDQGMVVVEEEAERHFRSHHFSLVVVCATRVRGCHVCVYGWVVVTQEYVHRSQRHGPCVAQRPPCVCACVGRSSRGKHDYQDLQSQRGDPSCNASRTHTAP
jgi:hypothetical protein